jgi:hypothetical protein
VARAAGVSTATVSRALNKPESVREPLRSKVLQAISKLGYVPHAGARALKLQRSGTVGAVFPTIDNAIFAKAIDALQQRLADAGRAAPGHEDVAPVVVEMQDALRTTVVATGGRLADDDVVAHHRGAQHHQDVGGVVVGDIGELVVAEMAVDGVAILAIERADVAHDQVDAAAAVNRVDAVLAFQPVGIATTPGDVRTAAAEDLVFAGAAMAFSSVSVVSNALLLKRYRSPSS